MIPARALACREFLREPFNHGPLGRAGVLCLVHEDMIDATIKTKQHPLRDNGVRQQCLGLADQIVEIERTHRELVRFICGHKDVGETIKRQRAVQREQPKAMRAHVLDPRHQRFDVCHQICMRGAGCLGRKGTDFGGERGFGTFACQKDIFEDRKHIMWVERMVEDRAQGLCRLGIHR